MTTNSQQDIGFTLNNIKINFPSLKVFQSVIFLFHVSWQYLMGLCLIVVVADDDVVDCAVVVRAAVWPREAAEGVLSSH